MPISATYTINNTDGTLHFDIKPGQSNGPHDNISQSDLTFYGYGRTGWGQEVDQNFYRLLENFACRELTPSPTATPATKATLGGILGFNKPIIGQHWFNTTTNEMFVRSGLGNWSHLVSETYSDTKYLQIAVASLSLIHI